MINWRYFVHLSLSATCLAAQFDDLPAEDKQKFQDIVSVKSQPFRTGLIFKLRNFREYQKMANKLTPYIVAGDFMRAIENAPQSLTQETLQKWWNQELIDAHHDLFIRYPNIDENAVIELCQLLGIKQLPRPTAIDLLYSKVHKWQRGFLPDTPEYGYIVALREAILLEGSHGSLQNLRAWALTIARGEDPNHLECDPVFFEQFCQLVGLENFLVLSSFKTHILKWQNRHDVNPHSDIYAISKQVMEEIDTLLLCDGTLETFYNYLSASFKEDRSFYFSYPHLKHSELAELFIGIGLDTPPRPSVLDQLHTRLLHQIKTVPINSPDYRLLTKLNQEIECLGSAGAIESLQSWYHSAFIDSGESPYFTYAGVQPKTVHWVAEAIELAETPNPTAIDKKYLETKKWLETLDEHDAAYSIASQLLEQFQSAGSYGDLTTIQGWAQIVIDHEIPIFAQATQVPVETVLPCPTGPNSRVTLRHREGDGVGYTKGYTTLDTFFSPNWHRSYQPFFNGRVHAFNNGKIAINLGLGSRWQIGDSPWVLGSNIYYDWRNSPSSLKPHQIGLGLEGLGPYIDFRINAYVPFDSTKQEPRAGDLAFFKGNSIFVNNKAAAALTTIQAEFGGYLPWDYCDLYLAMGPYYLARRQLLGHTFGDHWGVRFRLTAQLYDGLKAGFELTHDPIFNTNPQGYISFKMPFGPSNLRSGGSRWKSTYAANHCVDHSRILRRMTQDVDRFEIIPIQRETITFKVPDLKFIFVNNTSNSRGTFESPYPTLMQAQQNSKPGDIIVVFPGDGTSTGMDDGFIMKSGQTIFGTTVPITIDGNKIPALSLGPKPYVTNTAGDAITLAHNTKVSGLHIEGAAGDGLNGTNAGNYSIVYSAIINNEANGLNAKLGPSGGKMIANNKFRGNNTAETITDAEIAINARPRTQIFIWNNNIDGEEHSDALVDAANMEQSTNLEVCNNIMTGLKDGAAFTTGAVIALPTPEGPGPVHIKINNNSIDSDGVLGGISIMSSSGYSRVAITNNDLDDNSFFHTFVSTSGGQMDLKVNNNQFLDPSTVLTSLYIQATSPGKINLQLLDNTTVDDITLRNFNGLQTNFTVQSPTGSAAGVRSANTFLNGTVIFAPAETNFTFVPVETPFP